MDSDGQGHAKGWGELSDRERVRDSFPLIFPRHYSLKREHTHTHPPERC